MKLTPNTRPLWSAVPLLGWLLLLAHAFDALMPRAHVPHRRTQP